MGMKKRMIQLTSRGFLTKIEAIHKEFNGNHLPAKDVVFNLLRSIDVNDGENWSTLHYAAYLGLEQICSNLIENGADVNRINSCGDTPLHLACLMDNYYCIDVILKSKPDLNVQNKRFYTPLMFLVDREAEYEFSTKKLLEAGADPNISKEDGSTALHLISMQKITLTNTNITKLLIDYDANINAINNSGETPLQIAIKECSEDVVAVLVENGASINNVNKLGKTAMDLAFPFRDQSPRIFEVLAEHLIIEHCCGFSVNLIDLEKVCSNYGLGSFREVCEEEMDTLKSAVLGESNVTLFDILVLPTTKVARYLRNADILKDVMEFNSNKFNIKHHLTRKVQAGLRLCSYIEFGSRVLKKAFPIFPDLCIENIITYLSIKDCRNLDKAFT